jgi:PAS domain S-box-containing protein
MRSLARNSLVWRILAVVFAAYLATSAGIFVLVNTQVQHVVREGAFEVYNQRLEMILRQFDRQAQQLALRDPDTDARERFQDTVLLDFAQDHHGVPELGIFPFIADSTGALLSHPDFPRGDLTYRQGIRAMDRTQAEADTFVFSAADGSDQWVIQRRFAPWGWIVGYQVPVSELTAHARQLQQRLILVWSAVTLVVLAGLFIFLKKETQPLRELTAAALTMAGGDLDLPVGNAYPGELGVLAGSFENMREAIRRQLRELRESESRYRQIFDAMADGLLLLDNDGIILAANPRAAVTYGYSPQQLRDRPVTDLLRASDQELAQALRFPPSDHALTLSAVTVHREGRELETEISAVRLVFQGRPHTLLILRDVTDQRRLERQLQQSQKLESVGRLAGGIAHDFNNLLTPVLGYTEMLLQDSGIKGDARDDVAAIQRAGERARKLARQLLAFSRSQVLEMQDLDLGEVVAEFEPIVRRTLREDIALKLIRDTCSCHVRADVGQIEQIVMNLAINAMDAMPDGGTLELVTRCRQVGQDCAGELGDELKPGTYGSLVVRDSGTGIPPEIMDRIFEPFFTTKVAGKGTGLGLATIHGIVKQHGGCVGVRNRPEGGCEVEILLPCLPAGSRSLADDSVPALGLADGHGETVVLVEDDVMVREMVAVLLTRHGYQVRAYASPADCRTDLAVRPSPADLLLTDVVMPGASGPELRDQLQADGVALPTVFMSGYTGEAILRFDLAEAREDFVQKPLRPEQLLGKLRQALEDSV